MLLRLSLSVTYFAGLCLICTLISGCENTADSLQMKDLTQEETLFIQRMVILERTKAVALVDKETGFALLDSLAIAWGDSALERTQELAANSPLRSAAVGKLLGQILKAERDSLVNAPRPDRIPLPVSDPLPSTHPEQSQKS